MSIIYLDTETTGLDEHAEIVEIGIIDQDGKVLFESLVKPSKPVPQEAIDIHGIRNEDLANAPTWDDLHADVNAIIEQADCVGIYNSSYDRRLLKQTAAVYGLEMASYQSSCIMHRYADLFCYGDWQKLTNACGQAGIDVSDLSAHRAVSDCEMTRRLHRYIQQHEARAEKQQDYRARVRAKKMALVPSDKTGFEYFGMRRPDGYKTLSQLKISELDKFEFAGECCSSYGDRGYLFKPKAI